MTWLPQQSRRVDGTARLVRVENVHKNEGDNLMVYWDEVYPDGSRRPQRAYNMLYEGESGIESLYTIMLRMQADDARSLN